MAAVTLERSMLIRRAERADRAWVLNFHHNRRKGWTQIRRAVRHIAASIRVRPVKPERVIDTSTSQVCLRGYGDPEE